MKNLQIAAPVVARLPGPLARGDPADSMFASLCFQVA